MKKILIFGILALLLLGGICAAGCIGSDPIVGKWSNTGSALGVSYEISLDMNSNGTGLLTTKIATESNTTDIQWKKNDSGNYSINGGTGELTSNNKSLILHLNTGTILDNLSLTLSKV